jgi:predicted adenine nucleotide alpha hydrolase (AANH) superfamily ATPase/8-oxo-dGTP pyrophosphatase MutT (NUDIX family)
MNKINYQLALDKIIEENQKQQNVPSLLMHSCCAPCSSYCLTYLAQYFRITIFYYNPNISPETEYKKRVKEQIRLIQSLNVKYPISFVEGTYEPEKFYEMAKGLEEVKEGGIRCFACYKMRQREAAYYAKEHGFDYFTTTLSVSPHKNAQKLNEIGLWLQEEVGVAYLVSDFKKKGGYLQSIELSKKYDLYRQDYCGCEFSKRQREQERVAKEKDSQKEQKCIAKAKNSQKGEGMTTEVWDIYDEEGQRTGDTMVRGIPAKGQYMLCVHVYLYTPDKLFLLQKRSKNKISHPGEWDVTCGAVLHNEESIEAAKRETLEEIGIDLSDSVLQYAGRIKKEKRFIDIYFVQKDFSLDDCTLQKEEVEDVCLVSAEQLLNTQETDRLREEHYMRLLKKAIQDVLDS